VRPAELTLIYVQLAVADASRFTTGNIFEAARLGQPSKWRRQRKKKLLRALPSDREGPDVTVRIIKNQRLCHPSDALLCASDEKREAEQKKTNWVNPKS
jgi:hypothetical protein